MSSRHSLITRLLHSGLPLQFTFEYFFSNLTCLFLIYFWTDSKFHKPFSLNATSFCRRRVCFVVDGLNFEKDTKSVEKSFFCIFVSLIENQVFVMNLTFMSLRVYRKHIYCKHSCVVY